MTLHEATEGTLLGGRVRYAQFRHGYRTGIEPVLLAACIPARPGEHVLEAGCGAGAALLCLAARIPGLRLTGLERDPAMAALAARNAAENAVDARLLVQDVAGPPPGRFDHVMANPPWHDPASTRSPDGLRAAATHRGVPGLAGWIGPLAQAVAPRGTLTLILPAALGGGAIAMLQGAELGRIALAPLWPRAGRPAKLLIVRARRGRPHLAMLPGTAVHGAGQAYTPEIEAVLRDGAALPLGPPA